LRTSPERVLQNNGDKVMGDREEVNRSIEEMMLGVWGTKGSLRVGGKNHQEPTATTAIDIKNHQKTHTTLTILHRGLNPRGDCRLLSGGLRRGGLTMKPTNGVREGAQGMARTQRDKGEPKKGEVGGHPSNQGMSQDTSKEGQQLTKCKNQSRGGNPEDKPIQGIRRCQGGAASKKVRKNPRTSHRAHQGGSDPDEGVGKTIET